MRSSKWLVLLLLAIMIGTNIKAQDALNDLPIAAYPPLAADTLQPIVLYFTGDGGFNSFSTQFAKQLNARGFPVVSFNCLKYFWHQRTPEDAAKDAERLLDYYQRAWKRKRILLIGYSFGADISPFVLTRLLPAVSQQVSQLVLMSPSDHTDFEVHVSELFGSNKKGSDNIPAELNKVSKPVLIIAGSKESDGLHIEKLSIRNYTKVIIQGGHHYDSDPGGVINIILKNLK